jgi:hypothetical protein
MVVYDYLPCIATPCMLQCTHDIMTMTRMTIDSDNTAKTTMKIGCLCQKRAYRMSRRDGAVSVKVHTVQYEVACRLVLLREDKVQSPCSSIFRQSYRSSARCLLKDVVHDAVREAVVPVP